MKASFENESEGDALIRALNSLKTNPERVTKKWVDDCAEEFKQSLIENLETQGRGGQPPPLAESTLKRYETNPPDGSGIRNHIQIRKRRRGKIYEVTVGIPTGDPSMIAHVQNYGCTIERDGKTFYVPGRQFWSLAAQKIKRYSKRRIKVVFSHL